MKDENRADYRPLEIAPTLARVRKLQGGRGDRDRHRLFFIEGVRNFVEAVDQGFSIETLLYSEKLLIAPLARKFVRRLKRAGVPFARASPEEFRSISRAERASGIAAILRQRTRTLEQIQPDQCFCWVALSHVQSPGNFGSLLRTSAAIGAAGFILLGDQIDPYEPAVVRASMGALFKQTLVRTDAERFRHWIQTHRLAVVGASPDGLVEYDQVGYSRPTVLLLGHERSGLTDEQRSLCQHLVRIPMVPRTDSLNLAVAGSLFLYAVFRSAVRAP
ncbi:MAG TPA: RNA methyltransferase [Blastocatellia bacterium]|nr:RNA methyltransferase [Blastocatellia bacterium]